MAKKSEPSTNNHKIHPWQLIKNNFNRVILILLWLVACGAQGIDQKINSKYPFVLLNDDHGILTEP